MRVGDPVYGSTGSEDQSDSQSVGSLVRVATGREAVMRQIRDLRTILGTATTPFNGWLLQRSLETVSVRMRRQAKTARALARTLADHPRVTRVLYPGLLQPGDPQHELWKRQCTGGGSLIGLAIARKWVEAGG